MEVVKLLLSKGVDVDSRDNVSIICTYVCMHIDTYVIMYGDNIFCTLCMIIICLRYNCTDKLLVVVNKWYYKWCAPPQATKSVV